MAMLDGKKLLITGVVNRESIAYEVARQAQEAGAEVVLTSFGRVRRMTERSAAKLDGPPDVLELDVNNPEDIEGVAGELRDRWGRVDGILHAIAFAPEDALGGNFLNTPAESAEVAFKTSAYSLKALARGLGPKGVRVNLVSAGPLGTLAARGIPGFGDLASAWQQQAPLGWDTDDPAPVAGAILFLLSDLARGITGEILHVDGGFHAMGTALAPVAEEAGADRREAVA